MRTIPLFAVLTLLAGSGTAYAEMHEHHHDMSQQQMSMSKEAESKYQGVGVLKAVNDKAHKVQIAHEAIPALNWPPMVMWFGMHAEMPHGLQAGDSVQFELQRLDGKKWSITHIEKR